MTALAALYALVTLGVVWQDRRQKSYTGAHPIHRSAGDTGPLEAGVAASAVPAKPPISILKPLCGAEQGLYEQLRSFCTQDYPAFQLVFGVRDPTDPALLTVRRLQEELPALDCCIVVDGTAHGCNAKVSNLLNMLPKARHGWLILADSDITVPCDYLARVVAPLADPGVGLVTCAYRGRASADLPSQLGAMFINDWFIPSVLLAQRFGARSFVSGATIALRAEVLAAVGGLGALADQLADDYRLGELVRRHGLRIVLSDLTVETSVREPSLAALCRHELRWLRTVQSAQPLGYACCFPSFPLPTALAGAALTGFTPVALSLLGITALTRLVLHYFIGGGTWFRWKQLGLLPLREALLAALWAWSFCRREIVWREQRYGIGQDGSLYRVG